MRRRRSGAHRRDRGRGDGTGRGQCTRPAAGHVQVRPHQRHLDDAALIGAFFTVLADRFGPPSAEWVGDATLGLIGRAATTAPRAPNVCAGASQLPLVDRGVHELGIDRRRLFGSAPEALRVAVTAMTALEAGYSSADASLTAEGRPPVGWILPRSEAAIAGRAAPQVLSPPALPRLDDRIVQLWPPRPRTLAGAAGRLVSAALSRSPRATSAFVVVHRFAEGRHFDPREPGRPQRDRQCRRVSSHPRGAVYARGTLSTRNRVRLETAFQG